jgi:Bacteriocin-protection, YdeI or OmpD-Associated/Domain of unknown function (DUF1905)
MPTSRTFQAKIQIIGVNPYALLPVKVLNDVFEKAGKNKGALPIKGQINGKPYTQTLVKYSGKWRLYLNMPMRQAGRCDVGDTATFSVTFDSKPRTTPMHSKLKAALGKNREAKTVFKKLAPHYQKEIMRYINALKTKESVERNVERAIQHLLSNARFVGRNPPAKKSA